MMKEEFEKIVGETVSNEDYNVIETVYIWHPSISEVSGKNQISSIYRQFGMPVIHDMLETAMYAKELDAQRRQLMRRVDEIDQRFCKLQNGDLTEERCRKDADKLFTKSQNPQEWELAKAFLCDKYGKEIADFVIKEMDQGDIMKNWKEELSGLLKSGCTDSDIRQFIQKHPDISGKKIWNYVSDYYAPEQCKGCIHVQLIGMYPCSCCSVNGTSKNYYEKRPL